jgi:hypothetical protein
MTRWCLHAALAGALALAVQPWLQPHPLQAQHRPWSLRVDVGNAEIHETDKSLGGRLGLDRDVDARGTLRLGVALVVADMAGLDLGAEVIPFPRSLVSPFGSVGGGLMGEAGFGGTFGRVTGGMQLRANDRYTLRAFIQRGRHGGQRGPHLMGAGFEYRFGPRRTG